MKLIKSREETESSKEHIDDEKPHETIRSLQAEGEKIFSDVSWLNLKDTRSLNRLLLVLHSCMLIKTG